MAKTFGYGCVMAVTSTTGELNIGQLRSIEGPGVDFDDVDTTCLDSSSNYRTFVAGLGDPGEVSVSLVYDSTSLTHSRMIYYMNARSSKTWTIFHGTTSADADSFTGYVKSFSRSIALDDVITADMTIKVSGLPGYTT
jgi:hypothetical protein